MHFSYIPSRLLSVGLQLNIFSHLAAGSTTVSEVSRAAESSERGTRMLLDALVACGLLTKSRDHYKLTALSNRYLVREGPDYLGAFLESDVPWHAWGRLTEAVRSGQPFARVETQQLAEIFFPMLVRTLHVLHRERARRAARLLGAGQVRRGLRVLDVACGSAVWSIPFAEANPKTKVTAQDFTALLDVAREHAEKHGVGGQYEYLAGDLKQTELGEARYDLALLGNIVHSEGETSSRNLFRRLHTALVPGGRVVIADMVPKDDRSGPAFPVYFALNMLLNTAEGDTFTLKDYRRWLREAGFARVATVNIGIHSPLIVATRAG